MKIINSVMLILFISITNVAYCSDQLVDSILEVLKSDAFTIQYKMTTVKSALSELENRRRGENAVNITLVKQGNDTLIIEDQMYGNKIRWSNGFLYNNGNLYGLGIPEKSLSDINNWNNYSREVLKYIDEDTSNPLVDTYRQMIPKDSAYQTGLSNFKVHFLPFMPEENKMAVNGAVYLKNECNEYSTSGNEKINGIDLQFIEYKTPKDCLMEAFTRYYFDNGKLVKCVRINKDRIIEAKNGQQVQIGGYAIIDISTFTSEIDSRFLELPVKAKIKKQKISSKITVGGGI